MYHGKKLSKVTRLHDLPILPLGHMGLRRTANDGKTHPNREKSEPSGAVTKSPAEAAVGVFVATFARPAIQPCTEARIADGAIGIRDHARGACTAFERATCADWSLRDYLLPTRRCLPQH